MEYYEINVYYLIIIFKKADFKCKSDIVKFSEQSVGRRWKRPSWAKILKIG